MVAPERSITLKIGKCNTTFEIEIKLRNKEIQIHKNRINTLYLTKKRKYPILYVRYTGGVCFETSRM